MENIKKKLILAVALIAALLCGCADKGSSHPKPEPKEPLACLEIWISDDIGAAEALKEVTALYTDRAEVKLRSFDSWNELETALLSATPDLLFCNSGEDMIPVTGNTLLLAVNTGVSNSGFQEWNVEELSSLEAMCQVAETCRGHNSPFLSIDNIAELMESSLTVMNTTISSDYSINAKNHRYVQIYNILAETAFSNGLDLTERTLAERLQSGAVCIIGKSSDFAKLSPGNESYFPVPVPASVETGCVAVFPHGFRVLTEDENIKAIAEDYIQFVKENIGHSENLLKAGFLPLSGDCAKGNKNGLEEGLASIYNTSTLMVATSELNDDVVRAMNAEYRESFLRLSVQN